MVNVLVLYIILGFFKGIIKLPRLMLYEKSQQTLAYE